MMGNVEMGRVNFWFGLLMSQVLAETGFLTLYGQLAQFDEEMSTDE